MQEAIEDHRDILVGISRFPISRWNIPSLSYQALKGGREGWLRLNIIAVYLWQRVKKGWNARQENGLMMEEMGDFIESRLSAGRGIVIMGDFNVRVGKAVGYDEGSRNREGKDLVAWVEARDLRFVTGAPMDSARWMWMVGEHSSVIDYIMIGGVLGEDMIEMRVRDREGIDVPSDHKLIRVHIAGSGIKCDDDGPKGHRVAWSKMGLE